MMCMVFIFPRRREERWESGVRGARGGGRATAQACQESSMQLGCQWRQAGTGTGMRVDATSVGEVSTQSGCWLLVLAGWLAGG